MVSLPSWPGSCRRSKIPQQKAACQTDRLTLLIYSSLLLKFRYLGTIGTIGLSATGLFLGLFVVCTCVQCELPSLAGSLALSLYACLQTPKYVEVGCLWDLSIDQWGDLQMVHFKAKVAYFSSVIVKCKLLSDFCSFNHQGFSCLCFYFSRSIKGSLKVEHL